MMNFKRITAGVVAAIVMTAMAVPVMAAHISPITGLSCNNTGTVRLCTNSSTGMSTPGGDHVRPDGYHCYPTRYMYYDKTYCSGCTYVLSTGMHVCVESGHTCGWPAQNICPY